jgi:hypothetical protein
VQQIGEEGRPTVVLVVLVCDLVWCQNFGPNLCEDAIIDVPRAAKPLLVPVLAACLSRSSLKMSSSSVARARLNVQHDKHVPTASAHHHAFPQNLKKGT